MLSEELQLGTLTFRAATIEDLSETLRLLNICSREQVGTDEFTEEELLSDWRAPGFNLATDSRIALTPEGRIVGYVDVSANHKVPVHPYVYGRVHPAYEGQGIGTALMQWAEVRARKVLERVPPDARVSIRTGTVSTYKPAVQFLQQYGMVHTRTFWRMVIDLDDAPPVPTWAGGIALRTYNPKEIALEEIVRSVRDAFRDHWGVVENDFEEDLRIAKHFTESDPEFDPSLWFLAMDGDRIAGFALCRHKTTEDPEMGWINMLGVRRAWRKRGLGLALLQHAFGELYGRGKKRAGLGVDAASLTGATRLYEKAGMHVARRYDTYELELRPGRELSAHSTEE